MDLLELAQWDLLGDEPVLVKCCNTPDKKHCIKQAGPTKIQQNPVGMFCNIQATATNDQIQCIYQYISETFEGKCNARYKREYKCTLYNKREKRCTQNTEKNKRAVDFAHAR